MQQVPQASLDFYRQQQQIAATTVAAAGKLWDRVGDDFASSWARVKPSLERVVETGRAAAAVSATQYTPALLAETKQVAPASGALNPAAFLSSAPDDRSMSTLLDEAPIKARIAVSRGLGAADALDLAGSWLTGMLLTVMADTRRAVVGADIVQRPAISGYTRMLNPPSCSRCAILAGKWFRWNQGFRRHPRCDCLHVPSTSEAFATESGFMDDPYEYFNSLSKEQQERVFGRIESRAIRDGADIYRVENTKLRGLATAKGNLRYGTPSRMTVDDIYRTAGHRANAIRMLEREGYILPEGQVPGGAIFGPRREAYTTPISRPLVAGSNRARVLDARTSGVRDPLDRATMTAAERRLFDANYRLNYARATGTVAPSVPNLRGLRPSDSDAFARPRPVSQSELRAMEEALRLEVAALRDAPESVRHLAALLGIH